VFVAVCAVPVAATETDEFVLLRIYLDWNIAGAEVERVRFEQGLNHQEATFYVGDAFVTDFYDNFVKQHVEPSRIFAFNNVRCDRNPISRTLLVEATPADVARFSALDNIQIHVGRYPYVGSVSAHSNGTTHYALSNFRRGYSPGITESCYSIGIEHAIGLVGFFDDVLYAPTVMYAQDFELTVQSSFLRNGEPTPFHRRGSWWLHEYEHKIVVNEWGERYHFELVGANAEDDRDLNDFTDLYTLLEEAQDGEYVLALDMWWTSHEPENREDGYGDAVQYVFKIVKGVEPTVPEPAFMYAYCNCHLSGDGKHIGTADFYNRRFCLNSTRINFHFDLDLTNDDVAKIADTFPHLQYLNIQGNDITDISPLSTLTGLRELNIRYSKITDISPLAEITSLRRLSMPSSKLTDISPLSDLTKLESAYLRFNQITDVSSLANFVRYGGLLFLMGNPVEDLSVLDPLIERYWYIDIVETTHVQKPMICHNCGEIWPTCDGACRLADATMEDALTILRHVIGLPNFACNFEHDYDGNGAIEINDALIVLRALIGM
jgi:hypothetical protein